MTKIKYKKQLVSVKQLSTDELVEALNDTKGYYSKSRQNKILSELKKRGKGSILRALK